MLQSWYNTLAGAVMKCSPAGLLQGLNKGLITYLHKEKTRNRLCFRVFTWLPVSLSI